MSIEQFIGNTDCAVRVTILDGLGDTIVECPILVRPGDLQDLQNECCSVAAKFARRYVDTVQSGRFREILRGDADAKVLELDEAAGQSAEIPAAAEHGDGPEDASEPVEYPVPVEPLKFDKRGMTDPLPYTAGTNTLLLDVAPAVEDDGAADLCVMLRPALRRAARLAFAARDLAQRMRPDCEDESPSEEWTADASEAVEALLETLGECVEQLNVDFDEWNNTVVNKSHCVYLDGDDAARLAELCELLPGRDARGEPSGINRSLIVVGAALNLLAHTHNPAEIMAKFNDAASMYVDLARRLAAKQESAGPVGANEPEAEPAATATMTV